MTAAPEIPADVMAAAEWHWRNASGELINGMRGEIVVARAILAERQRCVDYVSRRPGAISHRQEIVEGLLRGDVCDAFGSITQGPTI